MGKQQKRDAMGKIYRQFSRQKYNKYKHQYPKMRQSEIVSKIIRQWDSLDLGAKQKLKKQYEQNKILTTEDFSESQLGKKNEEVVKRLQRRTTAKKEQAAEEQAIQAQIIKESKLQQKLEDNKQIKVKRQNIEKNTFKFKSTDYITFFRHYYERHRQEHPRWTSSQISKIIQLMWKKNKSQKKVSSKLSKEKLQRKITKTKKIVSGRAAFKKIKSLNSSNVSTLWKHLPIESKKYWQIEAQGKARQVVRQQKIVLRGGALQNDSKPFEFLNKMIV